MSKLQDYKKVKIFRPDESVITSFIGEDFEPAIKDTKKESNFVATVGELTNENNDEQGNDKNLYSAIDNESPSLSYLFEPFDFDIGKPKQFQGLYNTKATNYCYECFDSRDPNIISTVEQAEKKAAEIIIEAEKKAKKQAQDILDKVTLEVEAIRKDALNEIEKLRKIAEDEKIKADKMLSDAEQINQESQEQAKIIEEKKQHLEFEVEEIKEKAKKDAWDIGIEEGKAEGKKQAENDFQQKVAHLYEFIEKFENIYNEILSDCQPMLIELVINATEAILNKEIQIDKNIIIDNFKSSIEFLNQAHEVKIYARSEDIAAIEEYRNSGTKKIESFQKITFIQDEKLNPGDLMIETDIGRLNSSLNNKSEKIFSALRNKAYNN